MFAPKFRLTLALSLAIASLAFLALTLNAANARETYTASVAPRKAKILRRKDKVNDQPDAAELAKLKQTAQEVEERKFEDEIPKHLPIKFKLKAEKEKKFKDLKNPEWYRDFELEVTNTSDKPIYYLELWLMYAGIEAAPGVPLAVPLRYGRMNFIYEDTRPQPTDVPIQPGETYVFTVPEGDRRGWEAHKKRDNIPDPKKVILEFVHLSFGDGTGFATSGAKPYPFRRDQSLSPSCRGKPRAIVAVGGPVEE